MEDVIHFYSYQTHVSLALPIGWEELKEEERSVTYYYDLDDESDDDERDPKFVIQLFAAGTTDPSCLKQAADGMLDESKEDFKHVSRADVSVDDYPAVSDVVSYTNGGVELVHNHTFALVDDVLFSFSGVVPSEFQDGFEDMYKAIVDSARFVFVS